MTDLNHLYRATLDANPAAKTDRALARKLFRDAVIKGKWTSTAIDIAFSVVEAEEAAAERAASRRPKPCARPPAAPSAEVVGAAEAAIGLRAQFAQKAQADRKKGASRFEIARAAIEQMRFANGLGILKQTVTTIQSYGGWMGAILHALPKRAKPTDEIGAYLSMDDVVKLRTFDVAQ